jgi:hypothetical protein
MGSSENTFALARSQGDQDNLCWFGCQFLATFDSSSPCCQAKPTCEEVFPLVEDRGVGVEDLNLIEQPIAGQGRSLPNPRPVSKAEVERCVE